MESYDPTQAQSAVTVFTLTPNESTGISPKEIINIFIHS